MEKYIYDKNNGLWYELHGDYYIPCLTVSDREEGPIGIWGQRMNNTRDRAMEIVNHELIYIYVIGRRGAIPAVFVPDQF